MLVKGATDHDEDTLWAPFLNIWPLYVDKQPTDQVAVTFLPSFYLGNINIDAFSIISQYKNGTGYWHPSIWKARVHLSCLFNTMAADVLAPCIAMVLAVSTDRGIFWFQQQNIKGRCTKCHICNFCFIYLFICIYWTPELLICIYLYLLNTWTIVLYSSGLAIGIRCVVSCTAILQVLHLGWSTVSNLTCWSQGDVVVILTHSFSNSYQGFKERYLEHFLWMPQDLTDD